MVATTSASGLLGVFQGTIVRGPMTKGKARWIYVQSKNGMVRRVNIARATVEYDDDFPASKRLPIADKALRSDVEVRVTAEQDHSKNGDGEWQGKEIVIVVPQPPSGTKGQNRASRIPDWPSLKKRGNTTTQGVGSATF
jgi:hypothetical protein